MNIRSFNVGMIHETFKKEYFVDDRVRSNSLIELYIDNGVTLYVLGNILRISAQYDRWHHIRRPRYKCHTILPSRRAIVVPIELMPMYIHCTITKIDMVKGFKSKTVGMDRECLIIVRPGKCTVSAWNN